MRPDLLLRSRDVRGLGIQPPAPPPNVRTLTPGSGPALGPSPSEGEATTWGCDAAQRVQLAGGALNTLLVHPEVTPFEQLYRRLPSEGMFVPTVSPERPFVFELGAFRVPDTFDLLLFDLRPDIYRFQGVDPGDTVPVEARRFSSIMGFELTVDQRHLGNVLFQLDPVPIQTDTQAFAPEIRSSEFTGVLQTPPARFNISAASSFANAAGAGLSLLPQRPQRYGPLSVPFTLYVRSGQTVQVRCVIFRPIPSPIAFIEYDIAGLLLPDEWVSSMTECMKPLTHASGGPGSAGGGPR